MIKRLLLCMGAALSCHCQAAQQTWYFIRHFEKQQGSDPHLTAMGKQRAEALIKVLDGKVISQIYSTHYQRTLESVKPVAKQRKLTISEYDPSDLHTFAKKLQDQNDVLVVGHSNTTPQLIRLLGGQVADMAEVDFGQLFVLTRNEDTTAVETLSVEVN